MSYNVLTIPPFNKQLKRLAKKYRSLLKEVEKLGMQLVEAPQTGTLIGHNCYKIRIAIKSKSKGKSGGARIITHVHVTKTTVFLLSIYDKSEQGSISDKELKELLKLIQ
ncbi:MAG: type II toxin-antitoxin system RelE/ParE family toxin [Bacteroidota bacterium]